MRIEKLRLSIARLMAAALLSTGMTAHISQPAQAEPIQDNVLQKVFELTETAQTPEALDRVHQMREQARTLVEKKEYEKALIKLQDAYGSCKMMRFGDGEGQVLTDMAIVYQQRGQITRAKSLAENAVEVLASSADKKSLGRARVVLAELYLALDNPTWAIEQLDLAMKCFNNVANFDSEEAAKVMLTASNLAVALGQQREALQFLKGAATLSGQAGNYLQEVAIEHHLAKQFQSLGLLTTALEEAQRAFQAAKNSRRADLVQSALIVLGNCQYDLCEFANARKSFEEALALTTQSTDSLALANAQLGYAYALAATGDADQARTFFEKALPVLKKDGTPNQRAEILNAMGVLDSLKGNHQSALQHLREAVEVQAIGSRSPRLGIIISQNLAAAESRAGENRAAKNRLISALQACNTKTHKDPVLQGHILAALEEVCLNLKEIAQAMDFANKGIAVSESVKDDSALWRHYVNLARAQIALQQSPTDALKSAVSFFRSPQAGKFPSPERLGYPSTREELGFQLASLLTSAGMVDQALLTAEQLKEESFINEWIRRGGEVKPSDREIYTDLVVRRAHLHASEVSSSPDKLLNEWKEWLGRFSQLARENRALAALIAPVPINLAEITRAAQATRSVVLDYLIGEKQSIVFVIDTQGRLMATRLNIGRDKLASQVSTLLNASGRSDPQARETEKHLLAALYQELIPEPVQRALPDNPDNTVTIIPDTVLFNLPFAALLNSQGKFLVENHTLTLASSLGGMTDGPPRYAHDLSVVVTAPHETGGFREDSESSIIARLFDPAQVVTLIGKQTQLNILQEQAKNNAVLHFATPLPLNETNPLRSVVPFAEHDEGTKVTAGKLFGLSLPSDLAVWSGTSVNARDHGSAVKVFSRGLGYAGVRNVLMSLWVTPDPQRTSELAEFYRGTQNGLNQAQSLRKAQLLSMSRDPSPRNWAAFQLVGPGN